MPRSCKLCGNPIPEERTEQGNGRRVKYCSAECLKSSVRNGKKPLTEQWGVDSAGVGAITELIVAVDLMKKGYDVFRALSSATCDLVAIKDGKCARIEVKSGYVNIDGILHHTKVKDATRYDILAIATDSAVVYRPEI